MKLRSDDDIIRYQPVWIDLRGWELPVIARYVSWGVWFVLTAILAIPLHFILGWFTGAAVAGIGAGFIMYGYLSDKITNEVGLSAWVSMGLSEFRATHETAVKAKAAAAAKPLVFDCSTLDALTVETEPMWVRASTRIHRKGATP